MAGLLFVIIAITIQTWLMGVAIFFLDIGLIITFCIWAVQSKTVAKPVIAPLYIIGVAVQCFHFLEEFLTGFQLKFPLLFGYQWSDQLFAGFNIVWIALFVLNGAWLQTGGRLSYLLVYFYAIVGGIANGIAHPIPSISYRGYFPGLLTSPFALLIGVLLLKKMINDR